MDSKSGRAPMALKQKFFFSVVFIFVAHIACGQILQVADKKGDWTVSIYEYDKAHTTIEAVNLRNRKNIKIEGIMRPDPRMYWLSEDILRIDFGSAFAPDMSSYFFSTRHERFSNHIFFATNFVDLNNELVLCADTTISIVDIFNGRKSTILILPHDIFRAGCYWFCIGEKTKFDNGFLFLEYLVEGNYGERYKIKKYHLPIIFWNINSIIQLKGLLLHFGIHLMVVTLCRISIQVYYFLKITI